jgi:hypothetical protein
MSYVVEEGDILLHRESGKLEAVKFLITGVSCLLLRRETAVK